jgi:hypothetical protein
MSREQLIRVIAAAAGTMAWTFSPSTAADPTVGDLSGHLDLSVPQSPAFTALGVTPQNIVQSDNLRTVAAGVLNGVDPRGNLQTGLAVDLRPYLLTEGSHTTLSDYRDSAWIQFLSRAQVSFATTAGSSANDKAKRQAVGLNLKIWEESDPALGKATIQYKDVSGKSVAGTVDSCYQGYLNAAAAAPATLPTIPNGSASETDEEKKIAADSRKAISACLDPYKDQHWNAGSLELALAGTHASDGQQNKSGEAAWIGYAHSLGTNGQFIVQAQRYQDLILPVKSNNEALEPVNETDVGSRLRWGSSHGTVMLEGLWTDSTVNGKHDRYWRGSIGTEVMIFRDTWIQFAIGKAFSTHMFDNDTTYSGQLKFGFSDNSLLSGSK